jgi:hypothetical protein
VFWRWHEQAGGSASRPEGAGVFLMEMRVSARGTRVSASISLEKSTCEQEQARGKRKQAGGSVSILEGAQVDTR